MVPGQKVLVIVDQFEQWLHAHRNGRNTELVQALRQCDGTHLQSVVMVRDDFWLAVSRFLRDVEVPLVDGWNSALVDLFNIDHATRVLRAFGAAFGRCPQQVSWEDAVLFCNWLSQREQRKPFYLYSEDAGWSLLSDGDGYRLPTEAEWEYACRAETETVFIVGNSSEFLDRYAVFGLSRASECASKLPNGWGLFDMQGNVWEWCQDWHGAASGKPVTDPAGPATGTNRMLRGGGWLNTRDPCRPIARLWNTPDYRSNRIGFRVLLASDQ